MQSFPVHTDPHLSLHLMDVLEDNTHQPGEAASLPEPRSASHPQDSPFTDEKLEMEKIYKRPAALPLYETKDKPFSHALPDSPRFRRRRSVFNYVFVVLSVIFLITYVNPIIFNIVNPNPLQPTDASTTNKMAVNQTRLVPLEAHIMSKCPDARDCLRDLVVPAMEQVVDNVRFKLSYIGEVDKEDNIQCKHGQTECLGNILSLCAANLYPNDVKRSLGFSTCMILSYQKIPSRELVQSCALEHGIPFEDLNACASEDGKGLDLLEASVERSASAGVKKSCTVRVDGRTWCIRDGAVWKDCPDGHEVNDLVRAIQSRSGAS